MNKIHVYNASRMDENNMSSHRKMVLILNKLLCELLDGIGTPPPTHTPFVLSANFELSLFGNINHSKNGLDKGY